MTEIHLYPREIEVMQLICQEMTIEAIAYQLGISVGTVRYYIDSVHKKTDSRTTAVALVKLCEFGIIEPAMWINLDTGQPAEVV